MDALIELRPVRLRLTTELRHAFHVPSVLLSTVLVGTLLSVAVAVALITVQQVYVARQAAGRRLRYKGRKGRRRSSLQRSRQLDIASKADQPVHLAKMLDGYHLFLSRENKR